MMTSESNKVTSTINDIALKYSDQLTIRATIQLIPYIGGVIDTLLNGKASQIHMQRVENFLHQLKKDIEHVEMIKANVDDEAFADLMLTTFEKVSRTRSEHKRGRFANIITRQVVEAQSWEDAEMAVRLVSELEDIHIEVITAALTAPPCEETFNGLQVVSLVPSGQDSISHSALLLSSVMPNYSSAALRMACAELTAKSLLQDEGIGRWDTKAMQYFVATELASWLQQWLASNNE